MERPDIFSEMFLDGFFDNADPGPFSVVTISSFAIPTEEAAMDLIFDNLPVLINPFATVENVFGTNVLTAGNAPSHVDQLSRQLNYGLVPEPSSLILFGTGILVLIGYILKPNIKAKRLPNS